MRHEARRLEGRDIHFVLRQTCRSVKVISALYLSVIDLKPRLGKLALQRHLTAFEADLVVATSERDF